MKRFIILFICIIFLSSCSITVIPAYISKSEFLLGTLVSIKIYNFDNLNSSVIDECFTIADKYEQIFSYGDNDSELSKLNSSAYNNPVEISNELFDIIEKSLVYCKKSDGAFDIGFGKLIDIWEKASLDEIPPDISEINDYIGFKAFEHIVVDDTNKTVMYTDERVAVHLGACAKGYIEDVIAEYLKEQGVKSAILDFGGSITVIGDKDGKPFQIGITDPINVENIAGKIEISDKTVVTSGDYRRYFMYNGIKYHHILDSETGFPAINDINGVSIVCDSAFVGDCLSTAAFVLGSESASEFVKSENCGYIIITDNSVNSAGVTFYDET